MRKRDKRAIYMPSKSTEIYFKELAKCPPDEDKDKEIKLIKLWQPYKDYEDEGRLADIPEFAIEARNEVVKGNLRFVFDVAKEYQGMGNYLEDLVSAGNDGLFEAINRFDETRGVRFISYAVWWIRQKIVESVSLNKQIRLPLNRVSEDVQKSKQLFGATEEELASGKLDNLNAIPVKSIYSSINEEGDELALVLADDSLPADKLVNDKMATLREELEKILTCLDEREKYIVMCYCEFGDKKMNLEEIGKDLDLTRERVRQIKDKAMKKIRSKSQSLFAYL